MKKLLFVLCTLLAIKSSGQHLHAGLTTGVSLWSDNERNVAWDKGIAVGYESKKHFNVEAAFSHSLLYSNRLGDYLGSNSQMKYRDDLFEYSLTPMLLFTSSKRHFKHYIGLRFAYSTEVYKEDYEYQTGGFSTVERWSYLCYGFAYCIKYTGIRHLDLSLKTAVQLTTSGQVRLQPMLTAAYRIF